MSRLCLSRNIETQRMRVGLLRRRGRPAAAIRLGAVGGGANAGPPRRILPLRRLERHGGHLQRRAAAPDAQGRRGPPTAAPPSAQVRRPWRPFWRAVWTGIYLCGLCSRQEVLRRSGRGQPRRAAAAGGRGRGRGGGTAAAGGGGAAAHAPAGEPRCGHAAHAHDSSPLGEPASAPAAQLIAPPLN
jgi:hypothetical protein